MHPCLCPCPRARAGVALVLVLLSLAFITALVLAFFLSTTTELQSSRSYYDGSNAQLLADAAVNLVSAQIQNATVIPVSLDPASPANVGVAWISQPGLLRTFDDGGNALKSYKLYSSDNMIVEGSFDPAAGTASEVPADWFNRPAEFTDLNAPVAKRDDTGALVQLYPIVDGKGLTLASTDGGQTYDADDASGQPGADGQPDVHGFSVRNAPTAAGVAGTANPVPMPVRWLYQLRDGTLTTLDRTGKFITDKAGPGNPPVARLAFWADDETCKVNVNTAAGDAWNATGFGSFCDTPRATTLQEISLAANQPAQHEFQRYPGHPATSYLTAAFPFLTPQVIADLCPRIIYNGSSRGGTSPGASVMATDADRLYATVDELRFKMDRTNTSAVFRPAQIDRAKFFLTAQSRAPELNLFNQPRITVWPESAGASARTAFDNQIAFCSTIGTGTSARPYFFTRSDPRSATADYLGQPRNQAIYSYLQTLLGKNVPGFGGQILANYPADSSQILTEIFDYIRCTNLIDTTNSAPYTPAPPAYTRAVNAPPGVGHVVPIEITPSGGGGSTRGFGRTASIYSPVVQFYARRVDGRRTKEMGVVFLLQTFGVGDGVVRYKPDLRFEVSGLDQFRVQGQDLGLPAKASVTFNSYAYLDENGSGNVQGFNDLFFSYAGASDTNHKDLAAYPLRSKIINIDNRITDYAGILFPQYNVPDPIAFKGGTISVNVYSGAAGSAPIQQYTFTFPDTSLYPPYISSPTNTLYDYGNVSHNFDGRSVERLSNATPEGDYFRALEPAKGDVRLIAATKNVPAAAFAPQAKYTRPPVMRADGLRSNAGIANQSAGIYPVPSNPDAADRGPYWGSLVNTAYDNFITTGGNARGPAVPFSLNKPVNPADPIGANLTGSDGLAHPGDWDNGMGDLPDGPLINKADEGESGNYAYYSYENKPSGSTLFSPNRQVPSAAIFGSLSTGVKGNLPWQTLLFCPNPPAGNYHPGFGQPVQGARGPAALPPYTRPPDHLLLDLFTMPVVEPYAISEPFSTAGKVNLNYQMVPFTYLNRKTALEAVLRSTRVSAIPTGDGLKYKGYYAYPDQNAKYRLPIDPDETLKAFDDRFLANNPFRSASQICEMYLVPQGQTAGGVAGWWDGYKLTGDNLREKPYADLYGRLTTKSNTFTVHVRVQTLQKLRADPQQNTWKENRDLVTGEYRGSSTIEHYLDPNDARFSDAAGTDKINPDTQSLNPAYRFRTVNTKQFAP